MTIIAKPDGSQSHYADQEATERAKKYIARKHVDDAISAGSDPTSDAGQLSALYTACDAAVVEIRLKRDALIETGRFTPQGVIEQLKPEAERIARYLETLNDRVIAPRKEKVMTALNAAVKEAPMLEATADDTTLATKWASLDNDGKRIHLARALAGKDATLARALAVAHPLITDLSDINRGQLRQRVMPINDENQTALLSKAKSISDAERHLLNTITNLSNSV